MTIKTSVKLPEVTDTAQVTTDGIADGCVTKAKLADNLDAEGITPFWKDINETSDYIDIGNFRVLNSTVSSITVTGWYSKTALMITSIKFNDATDLTVSEDGVGIVLKITGSDNNTLDAADLYVSSNSYEQAIEFTSSAMKQHKISMTNTNESAVVVPGGTYDHIYVVSDNMDYYGDEILYLSAMFRLSIE